VAQRISKSEADYVNYVKEKRCDACSMFRPLDGCTLVKGSISPSGHCRFWRAKATLPVDR
jgi:hypothetical protein